MGCCERLTERFAAAPILLDKLRPSVQQGCARQQQHGEGLPY